MRGSGPVQAVLGGVFLIPLAIGVFLVGASTKRSAHANQVSRDLASMYAQGMDFSQPNNQSIALQLLDAGEGSGMILLTKMHTVTDADCGPAPAGDCVNSGYPVIVQRIVIGDPSLHPSSLGTPASIDRRTGNVLNWARDISARVADPSVNMRAGESAVAAETFLSSPDDKTGVYARTVF